MSDSYDQPEVTLQRNRAMFGTFSWQGQAPQYDQLGTPGEIRYQRFFDGKALVGEGKATIDTLLHYDETGYLDGILNTFPHGAARRDGSTLDDPGNSAITVRPDTPDGGVLVRALLIAEALRRWPDMTVDPVVELASGKVRTKLATTTATGSTEEELTAWVVQAGVEIDIGEDGNRRISGTSGLK